MTSPQRKSPGVAWALLAVPALLMVAFVGVFALADHDSVSVQDHRALAHVGFGEPWPWIRQDLTGTDPTPSYPLETTVGSPTDNPTSISLGPLLADLGVALPVVGLALGALWRLALLLWRPLSALMRRNEDWVKRRGDEVRRARSLSL